MSNANNLKNGEATQFRAGEEQAEIARQGGIASGKARREKKTIQKILNELLDSEVKDNPQFNKIAQKMGIESTKSVKDIFTMVCILNSVKNGNLDDLIKLSRLLGEDGAREGNNGILDELTEYMKNAK